MSTDTGLRLSDERAYITCHTYPDRTPILHISQGGNVFTLSLDGKDYPSENDLQAIRDLVDAVMVMQAEAERLAWGVPAVAS